MMTLIWDMRELSPVEKLALLALADWANDDGLAWPSIKQIADKTGCGERTVQRAFRTAETMGILTRTEVAGKGCRYNIHPRHTGTPATQAPPPQRHPTPASVAPNTPRHTIKDKANALPIKRVKHFPKPDGVEQDIWNDFLQLRKAKRAPLSNTALAAIEREAALAGWSLNDAIAECVARGWQAFKANWVKDRENGQHGNQSDGMGRTGRAIERLKREISGGALGTRTGASPHGALPVRPGAGFIEAEPHPMLPNRYVGR